MKVFFILYWKKNLIFTFIFRARNPNSLLNGWILSIVWNNCKCVRVSTDDCVLITFGWFVAVNKVARRNKNTRIKFKNLIEILRAVVEAVVAVEKRLNVGAVDIAVDGVNENVLAVVGFVTAKPNDEPAAVVAVLVAGNNEVVPVPKENK